MNGRDLLTPAAVATCGLALLATAASLTPSPTGVGTHVALGLPPCPLLALAGVPCPVCGMTTAFALVVRGDVAAAFVAQPFGALVALSVVAAVLLSPTLAWRRASLRSFVAGAAGTPIVATLATLWFLSWGYKIAMMLAD